MSGHEHDAEDSGEYVLLAPPASPLGALRALWRAIKQLYDHFFLFVTLGILLYLTLPTLILPGMVIIAMYRLARKAQTSPAPDFSDLLPALRGTLPWAPLLFLSLVVGTLLILINLRFYAAATDLALLLPLWLGVLLLWLTTGFYTFAIAAALERRKLLEILRVAFIFVAGRPLTTFVLWIGVPLLTAICVFLPLLFFLLPSLLALWATSLTYPYPPGHDQPLAED